MMISKFSQKIYFSPQTSHIISIRSLYIFSIQFWYKKIFLLFLIFGLREERERLLDSSGKKKISLTLILTIKTVDLCIK
jgi:hypothetical protein